MSSMKKTKEGINLKKLLRLKNTGSIFVIAGLLMIFVIASYTYILQSSYTKTALETEITRDTASADAVHKLVNGRIGKEDFDQIKDQSDEKKQLSLRFTRTRFQIFMIAWRKFKKVRIIFSLC